MRADLNLDDVLDATDADLLTAAIAAFSLDPLFDLNGDNLATLGDLDHYLESTNRQNGDADFNGQVDFTDFLLLADNFGNAARWSDGDFDANGTVEFPDFLILAENFGQVAAIASVPEPNPNVGGALIACLALCASIRRRHR